MLIGRSWTVILHRLRGVFKQIVAKEVKKRAAGQRRWRGCQATSLNPAFSNNNTTPHNDTSDDRCTIKLFDCVSGMAWPSGKWCLCAKHKKKHIMGIKMSCAIGSVDELLPVKGISTLKWHAAVAEWLPVRLPLDYPRFPVHFLLCELLMRPLTRFSWDRILSESVKVKGNGLGS